MLKLDSAKKGTPSVTKELVGSRFRFYLRAGLVYASLTNVMPTRVRNLERDDFTATVVLRCASLSEASGKQPLSDDHIRDEVCSLN